MKKFLMAAAAAAVIAAYPVIAVNISLAAEQAGSLPCVQPMMGGWGGFGGYGMMGLAGGYYWFGWLTMILVWVILILGILALAKWLGKSNHSETDQNQK